MAGPVLEGPAIDDAGAEQLKTEPEPAAEPAPKKPEVHERASAEDQRDFERMAAAGIRRTDKLLSSVAKLPPETESDLQDVIDTVKPAANYLGRRWGMAFVLVLAAIGIASWIMGKFLAARHAAARVLAGGTAPAPPYGGDGTAHRESM